MDLKFEVSARIDRPVETVFEAMANPEQLKQYFATGKGTSGRLKTGATVNWSFHDYDGEAFPVEVVEVEENRRITLKWEAYEPSDLKEGEAADPHCAPHAATNYLTTVTIRFEPLENNTRTLVSIAEEGWRQTAAGLQGSYGNCFGWTQMLCCLKAWTEHGINLRESFFR